MGYNTYTKLYNACVATILNYGVGVWGAYSNGQMSEKIQNRAARAFLGVHKYSANLAINGDMGWSNHRNRQKLEMIRLWNRIINLDDDRITKVIFNWEYDLGLNNWCTSVEQILTECGLQKNYETKNLCNLNFLEIKLSAMNETQWKDNLHKKPKLIFYQKLKNSYSSEKYVIQNLILSLRSSFAQLRFGVLPLHVETGRFSTKSRDQRVCKFVIVMM